MLFSKMVIDQEKQSKTKFIFLKSLVGLDFRLSDSEKMLCWSCVVVLFSSVLVVSTHFCLYLAVLPYKRPKDPTNQPRI